MESPPLMDFDPLGLMLDWGAVANVSYRAVSMPFLMVSSIILILLLRLSSYLSKLILAICSLHFFSSLKLSRVRGTRSSGSINK